MFLSPESSAETPSTLLGKACVGQRWRAMIRDGATQVGDDFTVEHDSSPDMVLRVVKVVSPWIEEGESDGVEACVEIGLPAADTAAVATSMADQFLSRGEIPLPPYMKREATAADVSTYQTTFA